MTLMLEPTVLASTEPAAAAIVAEPVRAPEPAGLAEPAQPAGAPATAVRTRARRQRPALSPLVARLAGLGIMGSFVVVVAVEPLPNGPQPVLPFWVNAISTATLVALLGCWLVLAAGRRSGLRLGAVGGAGLVTQTALCPALDHHLIAAWWWAQLGVGVAITALCAGLLAATRPDQPRRPAARWRY